MKAKQNNKLDMFNALTAVMESNKKIWSRVKEIEKSYKTFLDGNHKLNILKEDHEKSLEQLIDKKAKARKELILESVPIANVIIAFSLENKHKELEKKCNFSKKELKKAKDLDLVEHSKTIWREAKKLYNKSIATSESSKSKDKANGFNIHNYGLTGQMIDKLEIANVAFIEAHLELKDAILNKKKCGQKIASLIKIGNRILKNKLDLLMSLFKTSDTAFYKKYQDSRTIHKNAKADDGKKDNKKAESNSNDAKQELKTLETKVVAIEKVIAKRRTSTIPVVKKSVVVNKEKSDTDISKSTTAKPVVKRNVAAKPTVKRPVSKKTDQKAKVVENKSVTDEIV